MSLTDNEMVVLNWLASAYNLFVELPSQHPSHNREFEMAIHAAQRIVMCRSVEREIGVVRKITDTTALPEPPPLLRPPFTHIKIVSKGE